MRSPYSFNPEPTATAETVIAPFSGLSPYIANRVTHQPAVAVGSGLNEAGGNETAGHIVQKFIWTGCKRPPGSGSSSHSMIVFQNSCGAD
jgi:hypothetical protein